MTSSWNSLHLLFCEALLVQDCFWRRWYKMFPFSIRVFCFVFSGWCFWLWVTQRGKAAAVSSADGTKLPRSSGGRDQFCWISVSVQGRHDTSYATCCTLPVSRVGGPPPAVFTSLLSLRLKVCPRRCTSALTLCSHWAVCSWELSGLFRTLRRIRTLIVERRTLLTLNQHLVDEVEEVVLWG